MLDREIVTRPYINFNENPDGIDGRTGAQISGSFTVQSAQDLAEFLKIGALPIDLKLISQTQVSATLGKQALRQGLLAGIVGFVIVILLSCCSSTGCSVRSPAWRSSHTRRSSSR